MVYEITYGKDRYHEHQAMGTYCLEKFGDGGWSWGTPKTWEGMGGKVWIMYSMFGNTTFAFKNPRHYTWFILRWGFPSE